MPPSLAAPVGKRIRDLHSLVLDSVVGLPEEEVYRRRGRTAPPMAFHIWHLARWTDRLQARLPELTPQLRERLGERREVWVAERVAVRWGLEGPGLGFGSTGTGMDHEAEVLLRLPSLVELREYAVQAFDFAGRSVDAVDDAQFVTPCADLLHESDEPTSVGALLIRHLEHLSRHLGMIEALRGLLGQPGSATI
jgi:DinB superfamily